MILMKNFDNMKRWIKSIVLASQMKLWPETLQPQGLWSMFTHTHTHAKHTHMWRCIQHPFFLSQIYCARFAYALHPNYFLLYLLRKHLPFFKNVSIFLIEVSFRWVQFLCYIRVPINETFIITFSQHYKTI